MLSYQASGAEHDMHAEPGMDDRAAQRHPRGDDVQEAADCEPGNESDGRETHVHASSDEAELVRGEDDRRDLGLCRLGLCSRGLVARSTTASFCARPSAIVKSWRFGAAAAAISSSTSPSTTSLISAAVIVCMSKNDAFGDRVRDELGLVLADQLLDAAVRDHHLDGRNPAAARARQQALRDDALEDAGEDRADRPAA